MKETHRTLKTIDMAYIALGAVLIVVCSWISIPSVVPFTLQTFAIFFVLGMLGGKRGTLSVLIYILLGAIGLPVFSGFKGGLGALLGSTGGYIIGFLISGMLYILIMKITRETIPAKIVAGVIGMIACYAFGTAWFIMVYTQSSDAIGVITALSWCVIPFLIPDAIKLGLAIGLSGKLKKLCGIKD